MRLVADRGVVMNIDEHVEYVRQQFGKEAVDALDALNADTVALARPLAEQLRDFAKALRRAGLDTSQLTRFMALMTIAIALEDAES
jgi:DNA relaxase NicK